MKRYRLSLFGKLAGCYALTLAGCATEPTMQVTRVPVPVECREPVPDRPAMPTDRLTAGSTLDIFVQAAAAEIEVREGYEGQLRTALENCTKPISP